jgi:uncharacterized protein (TIGR02145 family)
MLIDKLGKMVIELAITFTISCSGGDSDDNGSSDSDDNGSGGSCDIGDYRTVPIGTQRWMAANWNCDIGSSVCYWNDPSNCTIYGRLYNWGTAKALCPVGWRLPTDADWTTLENFVGSDAGTKLKSMRGWNWNDNGTDDYGFSALPGNGSSGGGSLGDFYIGEYAYWWSATEHGTANAYYRYIGYQSGTNVGRNYGDKASLYSVRCVQD